MYWLDVVWDTKVSEAGDLEKLHNATLNCVKDSQSLVLRIWDFDEFYKAIFGWEFVVLFFLL